MGAITMICGAIWGIFFTVWIKCLLIRDNINLHQYRIFWNLIF